MQGKFLQGNQQSSFGDGTDSRQAQYNNWKIRLALKQQRKQLQKRLFGEHYNYSKVGLNKQKKYMIEQQKNTEIERSNRILLEKIQKISKRSVPNGLRKRAFTQEPEYEAQNEQKSSFKHSKFFHGNIEDADHKSHQHLNRMNLSEYRTPRAQKKVLCVGAIETNGRKYDFRAYIEKGKYNIQIELGKMNQKIKIDLENYKIFFRQYLERDHGKIVDYLKFNGSLFQLSNMKKQNVSVEEDSQINLPQIEQKPETKHRLIDRIDF